MASDNQETCFKITYIRAVNIPQEKMAHWYAVLSIKGSPGAGPFKVFSLDKSEEFAPFISEPSATIGVELFKKHKIETKSDTVIAQGVTVGLNSLVGEANEVTLIPTANYNKKYPSKPILVFGVTIVERADLTKVSIDPTSLKINPKVAKAMDVIRNVVKVGRVVSELNPIAKIVMLLVDLGVSVSQDIKCSSDVKADKIVQEFDTILKRNDSSVLPLFEKLGQVNYSSLVKPRPNQEQVIQELLLEISQCLNLLLLRSLTKHGMSSKLAMLLIH
ncbi:hypothetical protein H0H92_009157 [Tricholoma furcatifolium]|nr:hypothetical protein H0H92_009157 [Tricholoma furcatifolium]